MKRLYTKMPFRIPNFGGWVKKLLNDSNTDLNEFAQDADMLYTALSRLINNTGKKDGSPIRPDEITVEKVADALLRRGLIKDKSEAYIAAGGEIPQGFKVIREADSMPILTELPENFADFPPELQQALAFTKELEPEVQAYIYQLWREQARAHYDIEERRRLAEEKLIERERRIQAGL